MTKERQFRCFAVFGDPVEHSLSPQIHADFAAQAGIVLGYSRVLASKANFAAKVHAWFNANPDGGLNITMPFKTDAYRLAQQRSPTAEFAGAANTLKHSGGQICADTTDGKGLLFALEHGWPARTSEQVRFDSVVCLGAGGAVASVILEVWRKYRRPIRLLNRTAERTQALFVRIAQTTLSQAELRRENATINLATYDPDEDLGKVLVIEGSGSLFRGAVDQRLEHLAGRQALSGLVDLGYSSDGGCTPALRWAHPRRLPAQDGLAMLVGQAAESFRIWHGQDVAIQPVETLHRLRTAISCA